MSDTPFPEYQHCVICPRYCRVDRTLATGFCQASDQLRINLAQLHFGEEPPISGTRGSGTIFLSHCNLRCVFCQNHQISHLGWGTETTLPELIHMMLHLQRQGAHNINFVTPTHYTPHLREAIRQARAQGLSIPIVWNSNGYEDITVLQSLEGLVDVYLPDLKYASPLFSGKYSHAKDYPTKARDAIREMHRQVGFLVMENELATRGMILRLLVLPNQLAGMRQTLYWIYENLGPDTAISLMGQYYPTHRADQFPELNRPVTEDEYAEVVDLIQDLGFHNGFIQDVGSTSDWTPRFQSGH